MADFSFAVNLIRKYEGVHEKAYPNPTTGKEPYTIGYGTQFYPDGSFTNVSSPNPESCSAYDLCLKK